MINSELLNPLQVFKTTFFFFVYPNPEKQQGTQIYSHSLVHRNVISLPVVIPGFHCYWVWRCPVTREGYEVTPFCCVVRLDAGRSMRDLLRNHFSCAKTNT